MPSRRYTILIADRTSGVVRRVTISARPAVAVACAMVTLPVLIGVGAAWKAKSEVAALYASNQLSSRKRQLPKRDRRALRPDRIAAVRHR